MNSLLLSRYLQALALAPGYGPALDRAREIAGFYETDARDLLDVDKPEEALEEIKKGLEIDPDSIDLVILEEEIDAMMAAQRRRVELNDALRLAADYQAEGNLITPEDTNAYMAYQKVLELDPQNGQARRGLESVLAPLLDDTERTIDSGDLESAGTQIELIASKFENSRRVNEIRTRITSTQRGLREQAEVAEFLVIAQQQMNDGKLIEPELDNALDSYTEVLNRLPDNEAAIRGLTLIAEQFATRANEAMQKGEFGEALKLADNGLLAAPDHAELLAIQTQSTGNLSARDQEIQAALQEAQRLVLSGKFLPPGNNALDMFKSVEALDPGNEQAARALARLPDQVFEEASQQARIGNYSGARDLLEIAETSFADPVRFADMKVEMNSAMAQQEKDKLLRDLLESSSTLIASQPMTLDTIDQSAKTLKEINQQFPGNLTAASQLDDFATAVSSRAQQVSAGGGEEAGFVLVDRALTHYEDNQKLLSTRRALEKSRDDRVAEEARRLAALMGKLAIDAVPWGEVTEIKDTEGKVQKLPNSHSTPLLVSLMAGNYTVSIRNSDSGAPQTLNVDVVAQQVVTTTAKFDSMTADAYFERSSW